MRTEKSICLTDLEKMFIVEALTSLKRDKVNGVNSLRQGIKQCESSIKSLEGDTHIITTLINDLEKS